MIIYRFICIVIVLALVAKLLYYKSCKKSTDENDDENYKNTNNNLRINKPIQNTDRHRVKNLDPLPRKYPNNFAQRYLSGGYYYPGYYYGANALALPFKGEYSPVYNLDFVYPENTMYTMVDNDIDKLGWFRIGLLIGNKKNCRNDCKLVLTLYRKTIDPDREIFEYKIRDDNKPGNFEIFLPTNIYFRLEDRDMLPNVTGYEEYSPFRVHLDNKFRYAVVRTN
jgi:hypothetical protein